MNRDITVENNRFRMVNDNGRSILSREYVVEIMLHLREEGEVICTDLSCIVTSGTTRKSTIIRMSDAGLVSIKKVERPRLTYSIELTDKGSRIADDLKRANDLLNDLMPEPETNCGSSETERAEVRQ